MYVQVYVVLSKSVTIKLSLTIFVIQSVFIRKLNPIQYEGSGGREAGGGQKELPYQFFACNFYKRWKQPSKLSDFQFNLFAKLVENVKAIPSASSKLLNLNREHPSKKRFFWSNHYKIELTMTSVIKMLELPNLGHMNASIYNVI